jgi:hypothetical protein
LGEVFANASAASPPAVYFAKTSPNHPPLPTGVGSSIGAKIGIYLVHLILLYGPKSVVCHLIILGLWGIAGLIYCTILNKTYF